MNKLRCYLFVLLCTAGSTNAVGAQDVVPRADNILVVPAVAYEPADVGQAAAAALVAAIGEDEPGRRDLSIPVRLVTRRSCGCHA